MKTNKIKNTSSRVNWRMLLVSLVLIFVTVPVITVIRTTVVNSVSEQYNYDQIAPEDKSLAGKYPQWWFLSPDPNALPRQDYRVAALIGIDVLDVGDPIELPNPFNAGVMIPGYITGFDFQSAGYGTLLNPPATLHTIYALVSWTEGDQPFLFIRQSGQSVEQGAGYNNPTLTEVYKYGVSDADGFGDYHTVALLRFTVPDPTIPVEAIYLLQQFNKKTVLWLLSAE